MGKIKNFRVNLPHEYAKDKKWIDENIKPGDVDEYKVFKGQVDLSGTLEFPQDLLALLDQLEQNQAQIEAKLDLLFSILTNLEREGGFPKDLKGKKVKDTLTSQDEKDLLERRLKFYKVLEEVEEMGKALRTTELKQLGGRFSTAVSYSYEIFDGWKDALRHYKMYKEGGES